MPLRMPGRGAVQDRRGGQGAGRAGDSAAGVAAAAAEKQTGDNAEHRPGLGVAKAKISEIFLAARRATR